MKGGIVIGLGLFIVGTAIMTFGDVDPPKKQSKSGLPQVSRREVFARWNTASVFDFLVLPGTFPDGGRAWDVIQGAPPGTGYDGILADWRTLHPETLYALESPTLLILANTPFAGASELT